MSNKDRNTQRNIFPLLTLVLSLSFLIVFVITCVLFNKKINDLSNIENRVITVTEYIYVKTEDTNDDSVSTGKENLEEQSFLVKEHHGQIGIFSLSDGEIRYVIERYTKTLPEADKRLLQEGFVVIGMTGIYSVIEDYTG